ncbi:hypothetical protein [Aquiflexum gelatinilyticum]|uniref:Uncharacterized protein n=1 Tax=Aquiflexum gelatinilyticum TaxID=2961943 RepID=A0A9X2P2N5_9BACT|nr:hypothetical protein [Aquiflexum gelatinilyticum]MCR9014889.1 hypothetical protein [Aquiflexum gelatinilyticum]
MENLSIHDLGLILDNEIYLLPEETELLLAKRQNVLLEENPIAQQEEFEEEAVALEYEGGFEKGILVIYEGKSLESNLSDYLFKILGAVSCSLKDIALASSENTEKTSMASISALNPNRIIVFGKVRHEIMMSVKKTYEVHQEDEIEYLFADDLKQISESLDLRKALWKELQVLFNITKK